MNEERKMILEMLKDGAITVEEAERLLNALAADPDADAGSKAPTPKRILVMVTENGQQIVNVRVPFALVRAGLRISKTVGSAFSKYPREKTDESAAMEMLRDMNLDDLLNSINQGDVTLPHTLVNANDQEKNVHVQIIIE